MNQDNNPNQPLVQNRANPQLLHQHDNPPRFQRLKQMLPSFLVIVGFLMMINMIQELRTQNHILQGELEEFKMEFRAQIVNQRQAPEDLRSAGENYQAELEELKKIITSKADQMQIQFEEAFRKGNQDLKVELEEIKNSLRTQIMNVEELKKNILTSAIGKIDQIQRQIDGCKLGDLGLKAELQESKKSLETQETQNSYESLKSKLRRSDPETISLLKSLRV